MASSVRTPAWAGFPRFWGQDVLVLRRFEGTDHLNALFDYSADCLAATADVDFDRLIGTHA
ncbi:hypothetical protein JMM61_14375, partial [Rhodovulum sulfidophilum]|nr:hypothetical protein [Rhodovulum sulfidophilum]